MYICTIYSVYASSLGGKSLFYQGLLYMNYTNIYVVLRITYLSYACYCRMPSSSVLLHTYSVSLIFGTVIPYILQHFNGNVITLFYLFFVVYLLINTMLLCASPTPFAPRGHKRTCLITRNGVQLHRSDSIS